MHIPSPSQQAFNLATGLPDIEKERSDDSFMNMANMVVEHLEAACPSNNACGKISALDDLLEAQMDYLSYVHGADNKLSLRLLLI
jgi:hypothetical protein